MPFLLFPTIFCWSWAREVLACTGFSPQLFFPVICLSGLALSPPWAHSYHCSGKKEFSLQVKQWPGTFQGTFQSSWVSSICLSSMTGGGQSQSHLLELSLRCCPLKDYCFLVVEILYSTESLEWGCHSLPGSEGFFLLSLSVSSPRLLPALCQGFDFCQLWPGPFSYLLSFQLCSGWALLVY